MDNPPTEDTTVTMISGNFTDGPLNGEYTITEWNGDSYSGNFVDGIPNGQGTKRTLENHFQTGQFDDGNFISGTCKWPFPNGLYEGQIEGGNIFSGKLMKKDEKGRTIFDIYHEGILLKTEGFLELTNGNYEGVIQNGKPNGPGKIWSSSGHLISEGEYKDGELVLGRMLFGPGIFSKGHLIKGHGKKITSEATFVGNFNNDVLDKFGAEIRSKSHILIGNFSNGVLVSGKKLDNFCLQEGKFSGGFLTGEGKVSYFLSPREGKKIVVKKPQEIDNWIEQILTGECLEEVLEDMTVGDCFSYEIGNFNLGQLQGQGRSTLYGCVREGEFGHGKLSGKGKRTYYDGRVEEGEFVQDVFQSPDGRFDESKINEVEKDINGAIYVGKWPLGQGKLTYAPGFYEEGLFKEGKLENGVRTIETLENAKVQFTVAKGIITGDIKITHKQLTIQGKLLNGEIKTLVEVTDPSGKPLPARLITPTVIQEESGLWIYPSGDAWQGKIVEGKRANEGLMTDKFGQQYKVSPVNKKDDLVKLSFDKYEMIYNQDKDRVIIISQQNGDQIEKWSPAIENQTAILQAGKVAEGKIVNGYLEGVCVRKNPFHLEQGEFKKDKLADGVYISPTVFVRGKWENGVLTGRALLLNNDFSIKFGVFNGHDNYVGFRMHGLLKFEGCFEKFKLEGSCFVTMPNYVLKAIFARGFVKAIDYVFNNGKKVKAQKIQNMNVRSIPGVFVSNHGLIVVKYTDPERKVNMIAEMTSWGLVETKLENQKVARIEQIDWNGQLFETRLEEEEVDKGYAAERTWPDGRKEKGVFFNDFWIGFLKSQEK